jgi:hypothetical protein
MRRGARVRARLAGVSTIGQLMPGMEREGLARLEAGTSHASLVSFSGVAADRGELRGLVSGIPCLDTGALFGRSLAMGGIAMVAHLLVLGPGTTGVHLAASPEGPWYSARFEGVSPDSK